MVAAKGRRAKGSVTTTRVPGSRFVIFVSSSSRPPHIARWPREVKPLFWLVGVPLRPEPFGHGQPPPWVVVEEVSSAGVGDQGGPDPHALQLVVLPLADVLAGVAEGPGD